jgi:phage gp36-like protein
MAYCALEDILDQLDEAELTLYTDDAYTGDMDTEVVDAKIEEAGAVIDAYLAVRYNVPVDPVPAMLKSLSVDIAVFKLAARRNRESDSVRRRYEDAIKFLKDVAAGKAVIGGIDPPAGGGSRDYARITAEPRIFTRPKLKGF